MNSIKRIIRLFRLLKKEYHKLSFFVMWTWQNLTFYFLENLVKLSFLINIASKIINEPWANQEKIIKQRGNNEETITQWEHKEEFIKRTPKELREIYHWTEKEQRKFYSWSPRGARKIKRIKKKIEAETLSSKAEI